MRISDWSSDVCSSDLATVCRWASCCTSIVVEMLVGSPVPDALAATVALSLLTVWRPSEPLETSALSAVEKEERADLICDRVDIRASTFSCREIGSASCRERVCQYV